jgi:hypothetical protein
MQAYRDYYALRATVLRANRKSNRRYLHHAVARPSDVRNLRPRPEWVNWQRITAHEHETAEFAPVPVPVHARAATGSDN